MAAKTETATLAGGCFWCLEAVFRRLNGVKSVVSGYTGGTVADPTYQEVCSGETGHAEAVQIVFDPQIITFAQLLEVFWRIHDPTTLNRQGADYGSQYRSAIFVHDESQRQIAEASRDQAEASGLWHGPIVTEINTAGIFYPAERYHQDYYDTNAMQPYCRVVIDPKLRKLQTLFADIYRNN